MNEHEDKSEDKDSGNILGIKNKTRIDSIEKNMDRLSATVNRLAYASFTVLGSLVIGLVIALVTK